jgi:RNA polymerase sigma factor (sigma-70 family)
LSRFNAWSQLLEPILQRLRRSPRDERAWTDLVRATWPFVRSACQRHARPWWRVSDADDVAVTVFSRFAKSWHSKEGSRRVKDADHLLTLLAFMSAQEAISISRWEGRQRRVEGILPLQGTEAASDTGAVDWVDFLDSFAHLASKLNTQDRRVLLMRWQGYSVEAIAIDLGVATRTIERALERLRQVIGPASGLNLP